MRYRQGLFVAIALIAAAVPAIGAPTLRPAAAYSSGVHAHAVRAVDINGDGKPDLISANAGDATVAVMRGRGDGTFLRAAKYSLPDGCEPKSVAVGDVNGDGRPDIVTANQASGTISVLLNIGGGAFAYSADYKAVPGAHEAVIADFNKDGKMDVVVAGWGGSIVKVLFGTGGGAFGSSRTLASGAEPHSVAVGDFNRDGWLDFAVANHGSNTVGVFIATGGGGFRAQRSYPSGVGPHSIRTADLDGDGFLDLAAANDGSDTVSVYFGLPGGAFSSPTYLATGRTPKGVAIADLDGDGRPDILAACIRGNYPTLVSRGGDPVSFLRGLGGRRFAARVDYAVGQGPFSVAPADLNGDGALDLAASSWWDGDVRVRLQVAGPKKTTTRRRTTTKRATTKRATTTQSA